MADERLVPLDHEDSNYRLIKENLLSHAAIPTAQVHPINTDLMDDPEELADDYEKQLMAVFAGKNSVAFPKFDLILLGTGPDGKPASSRALHNRAPLLLATLNIAAELTYKHACSISRSHVLFVPG